MCISRHVLPLTFSPSFEQANEGFEFMGSLVADMIQDDPIKRPTIDEVAGRFDGIFKELDIEKLRSRLVGPDEQSMVNFVSHRYRRLKYNIQGYPTVPSR
jgi:hypothetical protein